MINLKLAEYDLESKEFERFLELGFFGYYGVEIKVYDILGDIKKLDSLQEGFYEYKLDKKDPLNRFDGLFDGRTYGEGRFVLFEQVIDKDRHLFTGIKNIFENPELNEEVR